MIRILIANNFSTRIIDKLNEIPEFEIIEKTNLVPEKLATEIKNFDAVVLSGSTQLTSAILKGADNLKIIVLTGSEANHVDTKMTRRKNIEIRNTPSFSTSPACTSTAENQEREGLDVIAILKDFFNV
jgi:D-3-phosphoglycerate dehydrogenase